jgi:hypothetical protein
MKIWPILFVAACTAGALLINIDVSSPVNYSSMPKKQSLKQSNKEVTFALEEEPSEGEVTIESLESQLKNTNAIERLNNGYMAVKEREKIAKQLQMLDKLRSEQLEEELLKLEQEVAFLEANYQEKLRHYGIVP